MKKILPLLLIFSLLFTGVYASDFSALAITTPYVSSVIDDGLYVNNGQTFLDFTRTSEALGAVVFECSEEKNYFIITRDGDVAIHSAGSDYFELNGEIYQIACSSFTDSSGKIYVPGEMIEKIFCISFSRTGINREMHSNYYNKLISNLLNYCIYDDFYPENFTRYFSFYCANPLMDPGVVINSVNIGLDKKYFDDASVVQDVNSKTILVNKINRLPEDYVPPELVTVDRKHTPSDGRSYLMDKEAYEKFKEMYDAARKEGLNLRIVSSYRTFAYQDNLFKSYVRSYGNGYAEKYSAHPRYSEHHTGLAIDINSVYTTFENSREL